MATFRAQLFSSLVILPVANALGHLAPAIGGSWAAVGKPIWDYPVLTLLFSVHALLDSYDKYRDLPRESRPRTLPWLLWAGGLFLLICSASYACGYATAIRLVWYLGLEVFWAGPLVPIYSMKDGLTFVKLKQICGPAKSVFCGVMAGLMDSEPASYHACILYPDHCASQQRRMQAIFYSMLYNFVRETIYDVRDIEEDIQDGITTMATFFGIRGTIGVLFVAAVAGEVWTSGDALLAGVGRAVMMVGLSSWVAATRPRERRWAWGVFSLFSLVSTWHAQAKL